jgi:hypothetical protein
VNPVGIASTDPAIGGSRQLLPPGGFHLMKLHETPITIELSHDEKEKLEKALERFFEVVEDCEETREYIGADTACGPDQIQILMDLYNIL